MKYCTHCGKEIMDEAVICPGCGCATEKTMTQPQADDTVSVGLCVLSALIPLFGIIYWPVKHKETPKKAKACGITAIIAWAVSFVMSMVMSSLILEMFF